MKRMVFVKVSVLLLLSGIPLIASQKVTTPQTATVFADLTKTDVRIDLNVRVVDAFKIMHESDLGKEVSDLLASTNDKYQQELGGLQNQIQQDMANFQSKAATMSETSRERTAKNIKKAQVELELLAKERQEDFQVLQQKQTEKMLTAIRESAKEVAARDGIDIITDKATGQVLYSSEKADLSNSLVKSMNTQFAANKAKTATAQAKPAAAPTTATAKADTKKATA